MDAGGDVELLNCRTCGRNFRPDVLRKHEPICIKNSKKKRKIFDSGKQRAEGSDIPINKVLKPGEIPKADPKLAIAEAKTRNWRQKHNALVESFQAARNYAKAKSTGAPLPPPPPAVIDTSLVQCPYCQRRFNEDACNRHVPFCKDQQSKLMPRANNAGPKKNMYKAPLPKGRPEPAPQQVALPRGRPEPALHQAPPMVSSNGTRQRDSPMSSQLGNSRSETSSLGRGRTLAAATGGAPPRGTAPRTQPSPSQAASSQARPSIQGPRVTPSSSSLPRGPGAPKKAPAAVSKSSSGAAVFCHECGCTFALASARFCSECGVRRLAL